MGSIRDMGHSRCVLDRFREERSRLINCIPQEWGKRLDQEEGEREYNQKREMRQTLSLVSEVVALIFDTSTRRWFFNRAGKIGSIYSVPESAKKQMKRNSRRCTESYIQPKLCKKSRIELAASASWFSKNWTTRRSPAGWWWEKKANK